MITMANEYEHRQERNEHQQEAQQANAELTKLYDGQSYTAYTGRPGVYVALDDLQRSQTGTGRLLIDPGCLKACS